ncbi:nuclear transport factor 2 family protein [Agrobacterium pusense]|uniref:nuclear transport factor 2 family protein n=1 Tax=Agrobacterium pusense TaxID=648995 RepID=UPI003FD6A181
MVLARYVRGADRRDGDLVAAQLTEDGVVEIRIREAGRERTVGQLNGRSQIAGAVSAMMSPHPEGGWSHHTTFDHIIDIDDDTAQMDAQFIMYRTEAAKEPEGGWPVGTVGPQGIVEPRESGYYRPRPRRFDGRWQISHLLIDHDLAFAMNPA